MATTSCGALPPSQQRMSRESSGGIDEQVNGTRSAPLLGNCSDASPGHLDTISTKASLPMLQLLRRRNLRWLPRTAPTSTSLHLVMDRLVHPSGSQSISTGTRTSARLSTVGGQQEESVRVFSLCDDARGNATVSLRRFVRRKRFSGMVSTSARHTTSSGRISGRGRPLQRAISTLVQVRLAHSTSSRFPGCRRRVSVRPRAGGRALESTHSVAAPPTRHIYDIYPRPRTLANRSSCSPLAPARTHAQHGKHNRALTIAVCQIHSSPYSRLLSFMQMCSCKQVMVPKFERPGAHVH
mmetsp:Transcript_40852/g.95442  ORF Transcript_40852/g.95442 Transcript_40852/m.95442 type:complete len:296 (+) Transcript_40852:259-1146(+)